MMARYVGTQQFAKIAGQCSGFADNVNVNDPRASGSGSGTARQLAYTGGGGDRRIDALNIQGHDVSRDINSSNGVEDSSHHSYVRMAKIAVALAIIRSTPAGASAEEHARHLCSGFQEAQLRWKESSSRLKGELLALRQQLLRARLGPEWDQHNETSGSASSQQDGQPLFTQEDNTPLFPTPPCSSEKPDQEPVPTALTHHVTFLHTFLQLRTLDTTPGNRDLQDWDRDVRETVFKAVDELRKALRPDSPPLSPPDILPRAAHTLVRYVESGAARSFWPQLSEAIGHLLQGVLLTILSAVDINQAKRHEELRRLILVFGTTPCLRPSVLRLLVHYITEYGHFLRRVIRGKCPLEPATFENIQHVLWCTEKVLLQGRETQEEEEGQRGVDREDLRTKLEDCLLHISDEFPLFALHVWQIIGQL